MMATTTTETQTLFCAAYQIDGAWLRFAFLTYEETLARITLWRDEHGFTFPMKIITQTTITTEEKV